VGEAGWAYVGGVAGVGRLEGAGDGHGRARVAAAAAGDGHLRAGDVELRDSCGPRVVDAELLDADQVVAGGEARRDVERVRAWWFGG
jgi:hypothetical protein